VARQPLEGGLTHRKTWAQVKVASR